METLFGSLPQTEDKGRFPYRYSLVDDLSKARIYFDADQKHILLEISGKGCKGLSEANLIQSLLIDCHDDISRIDVSADIRCSTSPHSFVAAGYEPAFKSSSRHISENGETCYVGSVKSDRQAAVYRYYEPHPRHEFLRVEHRFRRDRAKQMAQYLAQNGILHAVAKSGEIFGWKHPFWQPGEIELAPMPDLNVDAGQGAVINWLLKQVFPAMRRYERQGLITDLHAFVQLHLFEDDRPD
jgi:hypothetical protein